MAPWATPLPGLPGVDRRAFQDVRIDGEKVTAFQVRNPRCCKSLGAGVWCSFKNLGPSYPWLVSSIYIGVGYTSIYWGYPDTKTNSKFSPVNGWLENVAFGSQSWKLKNHHMIKIWIEKMFALLCERMYIYKYMFFLIFLKVYIYSYLSIFIYTHFRASYLEAALFKDYWDMP